MNELKRDARSLSRETQAEIRRIAVRFAEMTSLTNKEIAEVIGVDDTTISRWRSAWRQRGDAAFEASNVIGHNPRTYTDEEEAWIVQQLTAHPDPRDFGYARTGWTLALIQHWLLQHFGKAPDISNIRRMLLRHNFSTRTAQKQAREAKEEEIRRFREVLWPEIQAQAKQTDAVIVFLDECGIRQDQVKLRTWAVRGSRPHLSAPARRAQTNVISALSQEGDLWFDVYSETFTAARFVEYFDDLVAFWPDRPIIVVTDKHTAHTALHTQQAIETRTGIEVVFLPSYMPRLNPDESVWQQLKHRVHRSYPVEIDEKLEEVVRFEMRELQSDRQKMRNLFNHPDLKLYSSHQPSTQVHGRHTGSDQQRKKVA